MRILYILSAFGLVIQVFYISQEQKGNYKASLPFKVAASLTFFLVGLFGILLKEDYGYGLYICYGLMAGVFGDMFLSLTHQIDKQNKKKKNIIYAAGIFSFLIGHIFYLVSLIMISSNILYPVIAGILLSAISIFIILRNRSFNTLILVFGIIYIVVLMTMFSFSFFNLIFDMNTKTIIFFIGAAFFTCSDLVIVYNTFGNKKSSTLSAINLLIYYVAQLLIAFTIVL